MILRWPGRWPGIPRFVRLAAYRLAMRLGLRRAQDSGPGRVFEQPADRPLAVFIGDSITAGWNAADPAFFAQGFLERGISGQTTGQIRARFMADVVMLEPAVVHIMAGTNDIAGNGGAVSDADVMANIGAMVDMATSHGIGVVLAAIPPARRFSWAPWARSSPRIQRLNAGLRRFAGQRGIVFADYYPQLVDDSGGLRAEFSDDGVHPLRAGYDAMAPVASAAIAQAMDRAAPIDLMD